MPSMIFFPHVMPTKKKKGEILNTLGELQPLSTPTHIWDGIMDFIVGLPRVGKTFVIMVVFNHLSKYAHFSTLPHPFISSLVSQVFLYHIFKLNGMLSSIVLD
jgi:hypothetical protein